MTLSPSELATVLAALRYFQDETQCLEPSEIRELYPQFADAAPLSTQEIDALCEQLNLTDSADNDGDACDCEASGFFHTGVPGILAHLQDGRVAPGALVERCDMCERFASDAEAIAKLQELGIAGSATVVTEQDAQFAMDENGLLLGVGGQELSCDFCEARAINRRIVSVERPHDDTRNLCQSCDAVFMVGVQHGRYHEAALHGTQPGRDSSQELTAPAATSPL